MKRIQRKKILDETNVLLITIVMILSTIAVTANDQSPEFMLAGADYISSSQQIDAFDHTWIHFDDGTNVQAIGLTGGGTFEFAIRITPTELAGYDGYMLTAVRWHHGYTGSPPHSGTIKIYDTGTSSNPGNLITSEPFTIPYAGWFEIPLSNPPCINASKDIWVSVRVTHAAGEYPAGVGPGPVVAGKGGWLSVDGVTWQQLGIDIPTLNYNWNIWVKVEIFSEPPATPQRPKGPVQGIIGVNYTFSTITTDPEGDHVYYQWNWDDGTTNDWFGPYASGATASAVHAWSQAGNYQMKVRAKDINNMESEWSDPFIIKIDDVPALEIGDINGGLFKVRAVIKNTGSVDAIRVEWSIALDGGFILNGKKTTGQVLIIPADGAVTVTSDVIFGLGKTMVTVTAERLGVSSNVKEQEASVLLFFIKMSTGWGGIPTKYIKEI